MRVLYDHQAFEMQRFGGISCYFNELIKAAKAEQVQVSLLFCNNIYANRFCRVKVPVRLYKWFKGPIKAANKWFSARTIKRAAFDILHTTYYNPYIGEVIGEKPYVITVHDMNHELFPAMFRDSDRLTTQKRATIEKASHVIAISENTKNDLMRLFDVPSDKITVVYHGVTEFDKTYNRLKLPERFVLFVGARGGYKNFDRFFESFCRLANEATDLYLVCAGGPLRKREKAMIQSSGFADRVVVKTVSVSELGQMYREAQFFVYPSIYEGFGLPILEAFDNGCPIALSNTSCFPEIAQDAAEYFDPYSADSMYEAMSKMLCDEECRKRLAERGRERVKDFSWEKTAQQTLSVYRKVLEIRSSHV